MMQVISVYGPIAFSFVMMAVMAYTTVHVWHSHKRAIKATEEYRAALEWAARYLYEHPEAYAQATQVVLDAGDRRRMH